MLYFKKQKQSSRLHNKARNFHGNKYVSLITLSKEAKEELNSITQEVYHAPLNRTEKRARSKRRGQ